MNYCSMCGEGWVGAHACSTDAEKGLRGTIGIPRDRKVLFTTAELLARAQAAEATIAAVRRFVEERRAMFPEGTIFPLTARMLDDLDALLTADASPKEPRV